MVQCDYVLQNALLLPDIEKNVQQARVEAMHHEPDHESQMCISLKFSLSLEKLPQR